jgi:hypothetical protein
LGFLFDCIVAADKNEYRDRSVEDSRPEPKCRSKNLHLSFFLGELETTEINGLLGERDQVLAVAVGEQSV